MDGGFSDWMEWGVCSVTCSTGTHSRTRECIDPTPAYGGADCIGETSETETCDEGPCPSKTLKNNLTLVTFSFISCLHFLNFKFFWFFLSILRSLKFDWLIVFFTVNGGFSDWSAWDTCTVTCGTGTQTRDRDCTSPEPAYGGTNCAGDFIESQSCDEGPCPGENH